MRDKDVVAQGGKKISRWDAVFRCSDDFIAQQLRDASNVEGEKSLVDYSLVLFNTKADVVFQRVPLEDGLRVRQLLKDCNKNRSPNGGTEFAPAWKCVRELSAGANGTVMVLFLVSESSG